MKKYFVIILVFFLLLSCNPYKVLYKNFTYRYSNKDTCIDSLIDIDGYYLYSKIIIDTIWQLKGLSVKQHIVKDTVRSNIIFYNNGVCLKDFIEINLDSLNYDNITGRKYRNWIEKQRLTEQLFQQIVDNKACKDCAYRFYDKGSTWGGYKIFRDTIKVQYVQGFGWGSSLGDNREIWFEVIDKNTIVEIKSIGPLSRSKNEQNVQILNKKYTFIPVSTIPPPDKSWILKQKWFWCNEADREEYMKRQKIKEK